VLPEIRALIGKFFDGAASLEELRSVFDSRTRGEWELFGLKGLSGGMSLNTLVKQRTAQRIVSGSTLLASLWRGAWKTGEGATRFNESQLRAVRRDRLRDLYLDRSWAPSVTLDKMSTENGKLKIEP
jgi:hypothetical protein